MTQPASPTEPPAPDTRAADVEAPDTEPLHAAEAAPPAGRAAWSTGSWRRPSRGQVAGLAAAFVLGACLCGSAGLVIGAAHGRMGHHGVDRWDDRGPHGPQQRRDSRWDERRGPGGDFRRGPGEDFRRLPDPRLPQNPPAPATPPAPTATPSA
jgi:hypothetical protein